ncbi:MAG: hypothetical protein IPL08_16390 [Saprospiraceae bacterium]|nr:hypothetical protein [Saprospiraceae bacterium]
MKFLIMIKQKMNVKGEFFEFRFSGMILGLVVTACFDSFLYKTKMKSPAGMRQ